MLVFGGGPQSLHLTAKLTQAMPEKKKMTLFTTKAKVSQKLSKVPACSTSMLMSHLDVAAPYNPHTAQDTTPAHKLAWEADLRCQAYPSRQCDASSAPGTTSVQAEEWRPEATTLACKTCSGEGKKAALTPDAMTHG